MQVCSVKVLSNIAILSWNMADPFSLEWRAGNHASWSPNHDTTFLALSALQGQWWDSHNHSFQPSTSNRNKAVGSQSCCCIEQELQIGKVMGFIYIKQNYKGQLSMQLYFLFHLLFTHISLLTEGQGSSSRLRKQLSISLLLISSCSTRPRSMKRNKSHCRREKISTTQKEMDFVLISLSLYNSCFPVWIRMWRKGTKR